DAHHAAAAARAARRDQGNDEGAQPDAARPDGGESAEVRPVHAALRPVLRSQPAQDAGRADPAPGAADGADGVVDAVAVAGDAPADAGSDRLDPERPRA